MLLALGAILPGFGGMLPVFERYSQGLEVCSQGFELCSQRLSDVSFQGLEHASILELWSQQSGLFSHGLKQCFQLIWTDLKNNEWRFGVILSSWWHHNTVSFEIWENTVCWWCYEHVCKEWPRSPRGPDAISSLGPVLKIVSALLKKGVCHLVLSI